jgi:hypothetical protein
MPKFQKDVATSLFVTFMIDSERNGWKIKIYPCAKLMKMAAGHCSSIIIGIVAHDMVHGYRLQSEHVDADGTGA